MKEHVSIVGPRANRPFRRRGALAVGLGALLVSVTAVSGAAWAGPPPAPTPVATATASADLKKTQEQLQLEMSVADLQLKKELSTKQAEIERLNKQIELLNKNVAVKDAERRAKLDAELTATRERLEKLRAENDLAAAELAVKSRQIALNEQAIKLKSTEMQLKKIEYDAQIAHINSEIELRDKRDQMNARVLADVAYTKEPFKNGTLTISDRRIPLNGAITMATADRITERINYFNNQNHEYPIFIVIDESPGGSVAAGYKILRTMKGSQAPVYVVVKSFAASMAAGITTLAARSFAYPNAIILHHQLASGSSGNLTEHRENVKELEEWWKRLAAPVATKMGIGLEEFIRRMYQNKSSGDWREFGDKAKQLRWVDEIADVIREESYVKNTETAVGRAVGGHQLGDDVQLVEAQGRSYARMPRLSPVDAYWLYDPDNFYRVTQ